MSEFIKESKSRTIAKTITWRLTGTLDTFFFSWFFTNQIENASGIATVDTVVKLLLYYLHERLWQRVPLGYFRKRVYPKVVNPINLNRESHIRSVTKSLSWRIIGGLITVLISYLITGRASIAWTIGGTEFITKFILYYVHERMWQLLPRGQFRKLIGKN